MRLIAAQVEILSSSPPIDEAKLQVDETPASDKKLQDDAPALEDVPQVNIENKIQFAAPVEWKTHIAVWRAALSAWILRFKELLSRPGARKAARNESSCGNSTRND